MARKSTRRQVGQVQKRRGNRVFGYIRVSDTTGREDTLISPEVQKAQIIALAKRENLIIVAWIVELDKSGRTSKDREISNLIDRIEAKEADGILVWKVSRWGRNLTDSLLNIGELQGVGGFILSAAENLDDIETPTGRFSLTVLLAIAQMYSDEIGKTWSNIHDYRRGLGKTPTGTPRLGYIRMDDQYVPDPETGPWLRKAFESYVSGEALNVSVRALDAAGIRSTRGNNITYKSLLSSMDGGFAAGLIIDRRGASIVYDAGSHEPLITMELWGRYLRRRASPVPPRIKSAPYRLAGLIHCGTCNSALSAASQPGGRRFRCGKSQRALHTVFCESPVHVSEERVEAAVYEWLTARAGGQLGLETRLARAARVKHVQVDITRIDREIERAQKRLVLLTGKVMDGTVSDFAYKVTAAQIQAEIDHLQASKEKSSVEVVVNTMPSQTAFGAVVEGWSLLDPAVVNEGLRQLIRKVVVTRSAQPYVRGDVRVVGMWEPDLQVVQAAGRTGQTSGSLPSV